MANETPTWGGPHIKPPLFADLVLNVIGEQSDTTHGIEGINYLIYSFKGIIYFTELGMRNKTNNFNSEMVLTNFLLLILPSMFNQATTSSVMLANVYLLLGECHAKLSFINMPLIP